MHREFVSVRRIWAFLACTAALFVTAAPATARAVKTYRAIIALPDQRPFALHVEERGVGRPIVMLHGLGASSYMWRHLAPALAKRNRVADSFASARDRIDRQFADDSTVLEPYLAACATISGVRADPVAGPELTPRLG